MKKDRRPNIVFMVPSALRDQFWIVSYTGTLFGLGSVARLIAGCVVVSLFRDQLNVCREMWSYVIGCTIAVALDILAVIASFTIRTNNDCWVLVSMIVSAMSHVAVLTVGCDILNTNWNCTNHPNNGLVVFFFFTFACELVWLVAMAVGWTCCCCSFACPKPSRPRPLPPVINEQKQEVTVAETIDQSKLKQEVDVNVDVDGNESTMGKEDSKLFECCLCCLVIDRAFALLPCGHCDFCLECMTKLMSMADQQAFCPLCRQTISSTLRIFRG